MSIRNLRRAALAAVLAGLLSNALAGDGDHIDAIRFRLDSAHLEQFGLGLEADELGGQIKRNLSQWQYPFPDAGPYSHKLDAKIGEVEHGDTPVGFSFSSGNSDPRALDFQKADVLPVSCELRRGDNDALLAQAKSTFSARPLARSKGKALVSEKLIDQIGTACLNLLEDLPRSAEMAQRRAQTGSFKPSWMPDVRVEVKEVPVAAPGGGELKPLAPANGDDSTSNVELKKEIIIHNQGNPVIFTFGHERK